MTGSPSDFPENFARKYCVTTDFDLHRINQTLDLGGYYVRMAFDTREQQTRDALVEMGWTPPGADIAGDADDATGDTSPSAGGGYKTVRAVVECRVPSNISERKLVTALSRILKYPIQLGTPGRRETLFPLTFKSYSRVRTAERLKEKRNG